MPHPPPVVTSPAPHRVASRSPPLIDTPIGIDLEICPPASAVSAGGAIKESFEEDLLWRSVLSGGTKIELKVYSFTGRLTA